MKARVLTLIYLLWQVISALAQQVASSDTDVCLYTCEIEGTQRHYLVSAQALTRPANNWDASTFFVPRELRDLAPRGAGYLKRVKGVKEELRLVHIEVRQYARRIPGSSTVPSPRRFMILCYGYYTDSPDPELVTPAKYLVVMLPDGTIAEERGGGPGSVLR